MADGVFCSCGAKMPRLATCLNTFSTDCRYKLLTLHSGWLHCWMALRSPHDRIGWSRYSRRHWRSSAASRLPSGPMGHAWDKAHRRTEPHRVNHRGQCGLLCSETLWPSSFQHKESHRVNIARCGQICIETDWPSIFLRWSSVSTEWRSLYTHAVLFHGYNLLDSVSGVFVQENLLSISPVLKNLSQGSGWTYQRHHDLLTYWINGWICDLEGK